MNRILIVYFSHSGNTKAAAEKIQAITGGALFEVKTITPYPDDYHAVVNAAKKEYQENARPSISGALPDIQAYDTVFLGYPNWCGTMPMALFTFLEASDFFGKTVLPFCTHEGSGLSRSVGDIKRFCPSARVLEGLALRGSIVWQTDETLAAWIKKSSL